MHEHDESVDTAGLQTAATVAGPTVSVPAQPEEPPAAPALRVGTTVGRYVVLEEIAEGGMGRVLRAYDPKLQREVALKEVRGHMLGREAAQRLVAEARAMAKLSHPNVVAVYDVESLDDGRLVLVMEYVAGTTLRGWLAASPRDAREVIDRFIAAGRGLAAAHAAGLLHRDFKPANVLVGEGDLVKVTDFGLAKLDPMRDSSGDATPERLSDGADLTRSGMVLGTPRYMAPEQHLGETLSPAADQYAYCVALWESLVGEAPFANMPLVLHKQAGPPPWPGADGVPARVADAIRRGLAPRQEDRWPRVDALLVALSGDASGRRKRRMLGAAVLGVAVVGVVARQWTSVPDDDRCTGAAEALVGVWDAARRDELRTAVLRVEVPYAARVWERTAAALDAYAKDWIAQHTEACEATTIRGEQSAEVMDLRMSCLHRARVDLAAVTGVLASADADVVANAHDLVHRLRPLQRCTDIEALRADVEPPSPEEAEAVEAIRVGVAEAVAEEEAGRYDAARAKIEAAREALEGIDYAPARTEVAAEYGSVLERLGRYEESEAVLLEALELATTWRQLDLMRDVASALMFVVGRRRQRFDEALRYRELALGLATGEPRAEMVARGNLASVLLAMGDYAGAEIEVRRSIEQGVIAYGSDHHKVANGRATLAVILNKQGRYGEAETSLGSAIELLERALGPDHPAVCNARANLGAVLEHQGRYAEAEAEYRRALDRLAASVEPDHPSVCTARASLANALRKQEDAEGAEAEYRQAIACLLRSYEPDHRDVLMARTNLGAVLLDQKRYEQAEQEQRGIVALYERALGPEHPDTAAARIQLGNALYMHGEHDEAEIEHRRALAILERALGPDHLATALARSNVARVLLARGEFDDAVVFAEQAWARRQQPDVPPTQRAAAAIVLAQALWEVNASPEQRTRARTLAESADEIFRAAGPAFADEAQTVEDWLADPKPVVER